MNAPAETVTMLVNGQPQALLPAADRGLHYGDGVFETIAFVGGVLEYWQAHLSRLVTGCERLGIPAPDRARLDAEIRRLCRAGGDAVLKVIVTRGPGARGYRPPEPSSPTRILVRSPWPDRVPRFDKTGIAVRTCTLRLGHQPLLAGIKHLNRLEQVLARREWAGDEWQEGVLCDSGGLVIEGISSNLFLVRAGRLLTPDLSACGVAGIVRGRVLGLAGALGIPTEVRAVPLDELRTADEIFMTNSLIGIHPVTRFDLRLLDVGPLTRRLMAALQEDLRHA